MIQYEEWRDVPGYEGLYRVSNLGRVWSEPKNMYPQGHFLPQRLRGPKDKIHYWSVGLSRNSKVKYFAVHRLVALAFFGPRPAGLQTRHLDSDRNHNHLGNLRYGTGRENALDSVRLGTHRQTAKARCPLEHELVPPNLRDDEPGRRRCLACRRAREAVARAQRRGLSLHLAIEADRQYALIMNEVAA